MFTCDASPLNHFDLNKWELKKIFLTKLNCTKHCKIWFLQGTEKSKINKENFTINIQTNLSFCLSVFLSFCLPPCMLVYLSFCPSICLSISPSDRLSVCLTHRLCLLPECCNMLKHSNNNILQKCNKPQQFLQKGTFKRARWQHKANLNSYYWP